MTGDPAKGCKMCDVCKMLIRNELTRELDRYNGTKLKRIYKLTNQDMYKMAKRDIHKCARLVMRLGFVRWEWLEGLDGGDR